MWLDPGPGRFPWWLGAAGLVFVGLVVGLVVLSLSDPTPPTYAPTPAGDTAVADSAGGRRVTLDARDPDRWVALDLASGRVSRGRVAGWDLAARRFHVIANGGPGLPGDVSVAVADGARTLSQVEGPPPAGWTSTDRDEDGELRHPLLESWYDYDFFAHLLTPRSRVYVVRSGDGRLVKLRFLSYYCPGVEAGCVTLRYAPLPGAPDVDDGREVDR